MGIVKVKSKVVFCSRRNMDTFQHLHSRYPFCFLFIRKATEYREILNPLYFSKVECILDVFCIKQRLLVLTKFVYFILLIELEDVLQLKVIYFVSTTFGISTFTSSNTASRNFSTFSAFCFPSLI